MQHILANLKHTRIALAYQSKNLREAERTALHYGRGCKGILEKHASKKHRIGEEKPEIHFRGFNTPENAEEKAREAYERRWNLHHERTVRVRREARAVHLAVAFLKGMDYTRVELSCHDHPKEHARVLDRVEKLVFSYFNGDDVDAIVDANQRWEQWRQYALGVQDEPKRRQKFSDIYVKAHT